MEDPNKAYTKTSRVERGWGSVGVGGRGWEWVGVGVGGRGWERVGGSGWERVGEDGSGWERVGVGEGGGGRGWGWERVGWERGLVILSLKCAALYCLVNVEST